MISFEKYKTLADAVSGRSVAVLGLGVSNLPLTKLLTEIKTKLGGKCGGSDQMLTGQIAAKKVDILAFFSDATNG